ncbi:ferrous iron transporter B [Salinispora arenicola]|uniref:ferrous iron transporter B n=1 Tax=Salinispora arenicola TaxID=168697 RepID=UPI00168F3C34|nr:ferrous iron transporter B [Salinispora arenicola]NIL55619.1 ferrous iron transporter B [Salinispora arenicola]NIL64370.1 ferrous iron transporter B [Salinispora arenicola]
MSSSCHENGEPAAQLTQLPQVALVGAPNAGKTSVFNALTGLNAKTGNYPGVTVSRFAGTCRVGDRKFAVEDLPGSYGLDPVSLDEQVLVDVLDGDGMRAPDALLIVVDATTLRRSLGFVAQVLARGLPSCVVLTFTDELLRRQGAVDVDALSQALGVPVVAVLGHRGHGIAELREQLPDWREWPTPVIPPPADPGEWDAWVESVLSYAGYRVAQPHGRTRRLDAVLLHPLLGTVVFFAVMVLFFQTVFALAAPLQEGVEAFFGVLSGWVSTHVTNPWLSGLLGDALIGGVGGVLVFLPQIMLLFLLISLLEGVGYMSRAAFLMDRVMGRAGLEGRAFVALLSSVACAIPGIMATRTLPSAKDRIATMMAAPLMTCAARLPVYVVLIGLLVDPAATFGPFGLQGLVMFGLYLLGAVSAMVAAWAFKKFGDRHGRPTPFYLEMPPYRLPSPRAVLLAVWGAASSFLRKCSTIIVATTMVLWLLLNLPLHSTEQMQAAGVDTADSAAVSAYVVDHSYAAEVGRLVAPVFDPLGFDWRINVGVLSAQSARETFVATLGQVAAAEDPEDPGDALRAMTYSDGPRAGQPIFTAPTIAALLVYFAFALQCMATVGVIRRETGTWRWPLVAFGYLTVTAWVMAYLARTVTAFFVG